jgi:hypothetical protein
VSALSGQIADPQIYNDDTRKLVARARRETDGTTTTTEIGVLRIDGMALKSGRHYVVLTSDIVISSSVNNDVITGRFRYTTDGTTATTSSTQLAQLNGIFNFAAGAGMVITTEINPASDQTVSLLLSVGRTAGTGNVKFLGNAVYPICIWVYDMGVDTGDVGVDL